MLSGFASWCTETCIGASEGESQKPHQGFAGHNLRLHRGIEWSKSTLALGLPEWAGKTVSGPAVAANNGTNNPINWVIDDYSLLRLKQNWWKWVLGYGAKVGAVKLLKPAASTVGYLSGLSTLMMLGSTMLDAALTNLPPPPTDPCMGQFMGLNWVPGPNGTTVGVPACQ